MHTRWHQDVKPPNILVKKRDDKSPYHIQFKLADLGLTHFRKNVAGEEPADADTNGTRTYGQRLSQTIECLLTYSTGAPECALPDTNVTRSIDIWSLGCVFSEAATWSVFGIGKLYQYRDARRSEVCNTSPRNEDCFHDGQKTLNTVIEMHRALIKGARRFDFLTEKLIERLLVPMLYESPQDRPSAAQLLTTSRLVLLDAESAARSSGYHYENNVTAEGL